MHVYMIVIIIWPKKLYTTHTHTQELATTTNNKEKSHGYSYYTMNLH